MSSFGSALSGASDAGAAAAAAAAEKRKREEEQARGRQKRVAGEKQNKEDDLRAGRSRDRLQRIRIGAAPLIQGGAQGSGSNVSRKRLTV